MILLFTRKRKKKDWKRKRQIQCNPNGYYISFVLHGIYNKDIIKSNSSSHNYRIIPKKIMTSSSNPCDCRRNRSWRIVITSLVSCWICFLFRLWFLSRSWICFGVVKLFLILGRISREGPSYVVLLSCLWYHLSWPTAITRLLLIPFVMT